MTKAVIELIEKATVVVEADAENIQVKDALDALDALGEDAKGTAQEYKDLRELIDALDAGNDTKKEKAPGMAGIRMIGNQWHHKSDSYKKGFSTAQECAEHFNK
jgi:hypothetical protein